MNKVKGITKYEQDAMIFDCDKCNHTVSIDTLDILHSKKPFSEKFFEALMVMLVWVLIGILVIYFAKFFLFLIGAFLVISLVIWFKDRMSK